MRYYTFGRKFADRGKIKYAEQLFKRGIRRGDIKCAYGSFALKMSCGEEPKEEWAVFAEALPKIRKLAETGDGDACFIMAKCFESGYGGEMNMKTALAWYKKAVSFGCLDGAYNLGGTLCFNKDFPNLKQGIRYLKLAASANHKEAQHCLAHIYEMQENEKAAAFWKKRARRTFKRLK